MKVGRRSQQFQEASSDGSAAPMARAMMRKSLNSPRRNNMPQAE